MPSTTKSLLVELFVEELPPKALKRLGEEFAARLFDGLKARGLTSGHSVVTPYATARRLAAHVSAVHAKAADQELTRKVMPVSVALDAAGKPTAALRKALAKLGREALADRWPNATDGSDRLYEDADGKARALFLRSLAKGAPLVAGLQSALDDTIATLPIAKVMSYQLADGWTNVHFVRPARGLVALHGAELIAVTALGLQARRETFGHRFEAKMEPVNLHDADHYARQLDEQGAVIASFAHRRAEVVHQLQHAANRLELKPVDDDALLDEVTALVERPNVLVCEFEPQFLAVPPECLILTMKANQKYFPLLDAQGKLTHRFLVVSNIRPDDPSAVIQGNERVVRPRLADAKFFFDQDRKKSLESRLPALDKVVYHNQLGTLGQRVERVRWIAASIGNELGGRGLAESATLAASLAKADLLTDMVGEFPELQGVMGGYYARHEGLPNDVAEAIEDHYKPRFAGDALPRSMVGVVAALADKLETLVGLFGIGQAPTGEKDPFALRRHALGVVRILVERKVELSLRRLLQIGESAWLSAERQTVRTLRATTIDELSTFIYERLAGSLRERQYSAQEIDSVLSLKPDTLFDVTARLAAVRAFAALPEASALAAANKRIANILRKSAPSGAFSAGSLVEAAEDRLYRELDRVGAMAQYHYAHKDYEKSLCVLADLRASVDAFFDSVMVNADNLSLRNNRLWLLTDLHAAMNRVADLSRLAH